MTAPVALATINRMPVPNERLAAIPVEMRSYAQWVCWKFVERDGAKPTKMPVDPKTGYLASVTNPATWASFDEAVAASVRYNGVGFVFTVSDPYCGIDFDATDDATIREAQARIYEAFDSYSERSVSGLGLHIIVKGEIPRGVRKGPTELYSSERYFVMTGDVINPAPIAERQPLVDQLWHELGGKLIEAPHVGQDEPERYSDADIVAALPPATRGLFDGTGWTGNASADDIAFCNAVAPRTDWNAKQTTRLWLASALAPRIHSDGVAKCRDRPDYRNSTIARAFDARPAPAMTFAGMTTGGATWQGAPQPRHYTLLTSKALSSLPPLEWAVKGLFPTKGVVAIYGASKAGKSFIAIDLCAHVAEGVHWFGHRTKIRDVVFIALEGEAGIQNRIAAWEAVNQRTLPDNFWTVLQPFKFTNPGDIAALATECPQGAIVVIDTLAQAGDDDRNDEKLRTIVAEGAKELQKAIDGLVVIVTHTGKDVSRGMAGSNTLFGKLDAAILVESIEGNRRWRPDKVKDGKDDGEFNFALRPVFLGIDSDGDEITSCVIEPQFVPGGMTHKLDAERKADELFLTLLAEFTAQGRSVSAHPASRTHAANEFAKTEAGMSFKRAGFEAAMQRLFKANRIRVETVGQKAKAKEVIVAVAVGEAPADLALTSNIANSDLADPPVDPPVDVGLTSSSDLPP